MNTELSQEKLLLLRPVQAIKILGIGRSTFWRWAKAGRFSVIQLGPRVSVVRLADIEAFVTSQANKNTVN